MPISPALRAEIIAASHRTGIPAPLIAGIVETESAGDIHAYRVEPPYRYLVDVTTGKPFRTLTPAERLSETAPPDFEHPAYSSRDTEWWGQQASWGPMQVMGAVARENGFKQPFPALCTLAYGITYGAMQLDVLHGRFYAEHGWEGVAAAYNAGSVRFDNHGKFVNQRYVNKVAAAGGFDFGDG